MSGSRRTYWENVYAGRVENEVSWFQESPAPSLDLIAKVCATPASSTIIEARRFAAL
jgi:uncharacterized protein (DUF427 family)